MINSCGWCARPIPDGEPTCAPCSEYLATPIDDELDHRLVVRRFLSTVRPRRLKTLAEITRAAVGCESAEAVDEAIRHQVDLAEANAADWADDFDLGHEYVGAARARAWQFCEELRYADSQRWAEFMRRRSR